MIWCQYRFFFSKKTSIFEGQRYPFFKNKYLWQNEVLKPLLTDGRKKNRNVRPPFEGNSILVLKDFLIRLLTFTKKYFNNFWIFKNQKRKPALKDIFRQVRVLFMGRKRKKEMTGHYRYFETKQREPIKSNDGGGVDPSRSGRNGLS